MSEMTVSEWLPEFDGHDILDADAVAEDFEKCTGVRPEHWPVYTADQFRKLIEAEGRGGYINGSKDLVAALDLSDRYAQKLANYYSPKMGRGFRHRDNCRALAEAGY